MATDTGTFCQELADLQSFVFSEKKRRARAIACAMQARKVFAATSQKLQQKARRTRKTHATAAVSYATAAVSAGSGGDDSGSSGDDSGGGDGDGPRRSHSVRPPRPDLIYFSYAELAYRWNVSTGFLRYSLSREPENVPRPIRFGQHPRFHIDDILAHEAARRGIITASPAPAPTPQQNAPKKKMGRPRKIQGGV